MEEELYGNMILEEGKIKSIKCIENEKPTYNIYIDNLQTLEEVAKSEDALNSYNTKIKNNKIEIKGVTIGKKIKLTFTKIILKIVSWFR